MAKMADYRTLDYLGKMKNRNDEWVDIWYNPKTKRILQENPATGKISINVGREHKADTKWDAECFLQDEYGTNVDLS